MQIAVLLVVTIVGVCESFIDQCYFVYSACILEDLGGVCTCGRFAPFTASALNLHGSTHSAVLVLTSAKTATWPDHLNHLCEEVEKMFVKCSFTIWCKEDAIHCLDSGFALCRQKSMCQIW